LSAAQNNFNLTGMTGSISNQTQSDPTIPEFLTKHAREQVKVFQLLSTNIFLNMFEMVNVGAFHDLHLRSLKWKINIGYINFTFSSVSKSL
jgi:hypothetical protein